MNSTLTKENMENEKEFVTLDPENEAAGIFEAYSYYHRPGSNECSTSALGEEIDTDVICIGSAIRGGQNSSASRNAIKKRVTFADDEEEENDDDIEWIASTKNEPTRRDGSTTCSSIPNVFDIDDEMDDCNYSLQINSPSTDGESNVIDLEREDFPDLDYDRNATCTSNFDHMSRRSAETSGSTLIVSAIVHSAASSSSPSSSSPATSLRDDRVRESEVDDYDARMRACFGLNLDASTASVKTEISVIELDGTVESVDVSTSRTEMECDESAYKNVFDVEDNSEDDDCVITGVEMSACSDTKPASVADDDKIKGKCKKNVILETIDQIFKRMMPSAIPGVLSLFAPDRNCLPQNVRPSKFCYNYFVSSHIVVKEIAKHEFYKFKEQILVAKKSKAPPRCKCLAHPLNRNASKLTLFTNPYSLFHKPNCHFAQNYKHGSTKRKGPRRLSYQVTFHRVPQKREGKDFKDWSDIVIRRKQKASYGRVSDSSAYDLSNNEPQNENLIVRRASYFSCKNEPMDFDLDSTETITTRTVC